MTSSSTSSVISIVQEPTDCPEVRACLEAYHAELKERFGFELSEASQVRGEQILLLARLDGTAVGCCTLVVESAGLGEIKRFFIDKAARGLGLGRRLLNAAEALARSRGISRLQLDTQASLTEARALYASHGYVEVPAYNNNKHADYWFEKDLTVTT